MSGLPKYVLVYESGYDYETRTSVERFAHEADLHKRVDDLNLSESNFHIYLSGALGVEFEYVPTKHVIKLEPRRI